MLAERQLAPRGVGRLLREDERAVVAFAERQLQRIRQTRTLVGRRDETVHHQIDGDLARALAERDEVRVVEVLDLAVEAHALKTALAQSWQLLAQHAGPRMQAGREQHDAFARTGSEHVRDVVVERALEHAAAVLRATLLAGERPEQLRVVGDLGDGGDGAARRVAARALLDGEHRRKAMDKIDVGALELVEHLTRLRREALHVFAIALGVDRVEGQRRLARAAGAGEDHEFAARQPQLEVLQVVLAGAFDVDVGRSLHGNGWLP